MKNLISKTVSNEVNTYLILDLDRTKPTQDKYENKVNKELLRIGKAYGYSELSRKSINRAKQIKVFATTSKSNGVTQLNYISTNEPSKEIQIISSVSKERILDFKQTAKKYIKMSLIGLLFWAPASAAVIMSFMPGVKGNKPTDPEYMVWFLNWLGLNSLLLFHLTKSVLKFVKADNALLTFAFLRQIITASEVTEKSFKKQIREINS